MLSQEGVAMQSYLYELHPSEYVSPIAETSDTMQPSGIAHTHHRIQGLDTILVRDFTAFCFQLELAELAVIGNTSDVSR